MSIGVGDAEPGEHDCLQPFHASGRRRRHVVEAKKVKHAVDNEMGKVIRQRLALCRRFRGDGAEGEDDIAERQRRARLRHCDDAVLRGERQHIGRRVLAPPFRIEPPQHRIIAEHDAELDAGRTRQQPGRRGGKRGLSSSLADRTATAHGLAPFRARLRNVDGDAAIERFGGHLSNV